MAPKRTEFITMVAISLMLVIPPPFGAGVAFVDLLVSCVVKGGHSVESVPREAD